ncbi:MAG: nickel-dependent lactate racemase family protein [Candidatus Methanofastidiosia archaeon]
MIEKIFYGNREIEIKLPDHVNVEIVRLKETEKKDIFDELEKGISSPIDSCTLDEFIMPCKKMLIVVNDHTRPTPTKRILEFLKDKVANKDIHYIVACGTHRTPTPRELEKIFGKNRTDISIHSADRSKLDYYGKTSRGTEVYFNAILKKYDKVININSVEPHYFAGYTGGRKSFLPGLAGFETIEHNHCLALDSDARVINLIKNPVHEDMCEAVEKLTNSIFSINVLLDSQHDVYEAYCGDVFASFEKACKKARGIYTARIKGRADVAITVSKPPNDIDLYQSQKAIDNAKTAVKRGGTLLLVSRCKEGTGDNTFLKLLKKHDRPENVLEEIKKNYKLGYHKAAKLAEIATWAKMAAFTLVKEDDLSKAFIKKVDNLDSFLEKELGKDKEKVILIPDGAITVPTC